MNYKREIIEEELYLKQSYKGGEFIGKKLTHVNSHKRRRAGATRGPKPIKVKTHRRRTKK